MPFPIRGGVLPISARKTFSRLSLAALCATSGFSTTTSAQALLPNMVQVSAGYRFACGVDSGGAVLCWGSGAGGELGDGSQSDHGYPLGVAGIATGATKIRAGDVHACAIVGGAARCWGAGQYGELGDGQGKGSAVPVTPVGMTSGVTDIAAGSLSSCAVMSGAAWCWGSNSSGELGNSTNDPSFVPVPVSGLTSGVTAIAVGDEFACAIVSGAAKCWGDDSVGQLGSGQDNVPSNVPVAVAGLSSAVQKIAIGGNTACALLSSGVKCWGAGYNGELGNGSTGAYSTTPVDVVGLSSGVTDLAVGDAHVCALVGTSVAKCWGYNAEGELGNGTYLPSDVPSDVLFPSADFTSIAAGGGHTCAVSSGNVYCWGDNDVGQLGDPALPQPPAPSNPTPVAGLAGAITALAAGDHHVCAAGVSGAWCWGDNRYGQLGDGTTTVRGLPTMVGAPVTSAGTVSTRADHSCAVVAGAAYCWGANDLGQLGDGGTNPSTSPVAVSGLASGVSAIAVGASHTCAVVNGAAKCWGSNLSGALGNTSVVQMSTLPVDVSGLGSGVSAIVAGVDHSCAIVNGGAKCWGSEGRGQLGNGVATPGLTAPTPVDVNGLTSGVSAIAAGVDYTCAIANGAAWCWGGNSTGRLGGPSPLDSAVPVAVVGVTSGATAISTGVERACAVVDSAAWCWGNPGPAAVMYGWEAGVSAVEVGDSYACAIVLGVVSCQGDNYYGELGLGGVPFMLTPVAVQARDEIFGNGFGG